jgi:hypothetical protein
MKVLGFSKMDMEKRRELFEKIKRGDTSLAEELREAWKVKIWTWEAIRALNYLKGTKEIEMSEVIRLKEPRFIEVEIGVTKPHYQPAKVNWIKDIGEGYFLAGITFQDRFAGDAYGGGSDVWMLRLDPDEGFIPLFSTTELPGG